MSISNQRAGAVHLIVRDECLTLKSASTSRGFHDQISGLSIQNISTSSVYPNWDSSAGLSGSMVIINQTAIPLY